MGKKVPQTQDPSLSNNKKLKVIFRISAMTDEKTKQIAMQAASKVRGIDKIFADEREQKLTIIGQVNVIEIAKKLKKVKKKIGTVDIVKVGPDSADRRRRYKVIYYALLQVLFPVVQLAL